MVMDGWSCCPVNQPVEHFRIFFHFGLFARAARAALVPAEQRQHINFQAGFFLFTPPPPRNRPTIIYLFHSLLRNNPEPNRPQPSLSPHPRPHPPTTNQHHPPSPSAPISPHVLDKPRSTPSTASSTVDEKIPSAACSRTGAAAAATAVLLGCQVSFVRSAEWSRFRGPAEQRRTAIASVAWHWSPELLYRNPYHTLSTCSNSTCQHQKKKKPTETGIPRQYSDPPFRNETSR